MKLSLYYGTCYITACILIATINNFSNAFTSPPSSSKTRSHVLCPSRTASPPFTQNKKKPNTHTLQPLQAAGGPSAIALSLLSSPLASLILLASVVLVHESGHYLAARSFGIEVEEFSIGVGPKLFGFKAFGDDFNLRAIPLGGYVRFPENFNITQVQQLERKALASMRAFDAKLEQENKDIKYTILNALTLGALGDKRRKQEKERRARLKEEAAGKPWWSQRSSSFSSNLKVKVEEEEEAELFDIDDVKIDYYKDPNLLQNRPWFERAVVLSAGIIFNLLLSFFIYFGEISYGPGVPRPIFEPGAVVTAIPRPDSAASGVLRKGDVIVSVNGVPVTKLSSNNQKSTISTAQAQKSISDVISQIRATPDGESLHLTVFHQGDGPAATTPVEVDVRPKRVGEDGPQTIGVLLSPNFVQSEVIRASSFAEGSVRAAQYVGTLTAETAKGLLSIVGDFATKGKGPGNQISGPIGLIKTGSEVVATQDWSTVLMFAAAISINLAVVNAFPLPALDGGQLLFVLSEALSGKKIDQRVQEGISGAALFFLLLATVGAAFSDIENIFLR